jgi:hypothetical protein
MRDELMRLLREVTERDETEPGTLVQAFQFERDNPNVLWEYIVYANPEARALHRKHNDEHDHLMPGLEEAFSTWPYRHLCEPLCAKGIDFT